MTELDPKNPADFRKALGHFPSGLVVLTTAHEGKLYGVTCQAFCSVSLEPPLVGSFLGVASGSLWAIEQAGAFAVHVLSREQEVLARRFAESGTDKFAGTGYTLSGNGIPILDGVSAWMECTVHDIHPSGDHKLLLGLVGALSCEHDERPLLYWRGGYGTMA